jgi:hypothetical protein
MSHDCFSKLVTNLISEDILFDSLDTEPASDDEEEEEEEGDDDKRVGGGSCADTGDKSATVAVATEEEEEEVGTENGCGGGGVTRLPRTEAVISLREEELSFQLFPSCPFGISPTKRECVTWRA